MYILRHRAFADILTSEHYLNIYKWIFILVLFIKSMLHWDRIDRMLSTT